MNPWWIALSSPIVAVVAAFVATRRARRRAQAAVAEAARERTLAARARDQQALDAELARGFDLIDTETAVVELVASAVSRVGWVGPVELHLVARDAPSLELALSTARPPRPLEPRDWSPWECVAARTGTTVRSADTSRLDACPHLRSRLDAPHAVSVPLLVRGRILGVLHAVSADGAAPDDEAVAALETVARHAAVHLALVRMWSRADGTVDLAALPGAPADAIATSDDPRAIVLPAAPPVAVRVRTTVMAEPFRTDATRRVEPGTAKVPNPQTKVPNPQTKAPNQTKAQTRRRAERAERAGAVVPPLRIADAAAVEERVEALLADGVTFSVALAHVDHFRALTDRYGDEQMDKVLRRLAVTLRRAVRPGDVVGRVGEQFVVVLPGINAEAGRKAMERVRERLALAQIGRPEPTITCSIGIADSDMGREMPAIFTFAALALDEARAQGRNRVVVAGAMEMRRMHPAYGD